MVVGAVAQAKRAVLEQTGHDTGHVLPAAMSRLPLAHLLLGRPDAALTVVLLALFGAVVATVPETKVYQLSSVFLAFM